MLLGQATGALFALAPTLVGAPILSSTSPGRSPSPLEAREKATPTSSYRLQAHLDEKSHLVRGSGTISFTNRSQQSVKELFFHLYLNAFSSQESLFLRDQAGRNGGRRGKPGHIVVQKLTSPSFGDSNLWDSAEAHSPDDPKDRTDIRVPLPGVIQAGETIELHIEFSSQLPEIVERTGFDRDFHLIAQWFPKLAKLEPNGRWAHFAFHPYGEFYADFGNYDIELNVDEDYIVGSTGSLEKIASIGGRTIYRARAESVHDFAWTAWPGYEVESRPIDGVLVRLLSPAHTPNSKARTWKTLEASLPFLAHAYGRYPHPTLTVAHPPRFAARAGGMEYPSFITTGGNEFATLIGLKSQELLTVHELGHQWFQGLLASNEHAHPFLDEGLTSYAEWRYLQTTYGSSSLLKWPWLDIERVAVGRYGALRAQREPPNQSVSEFNSFDSLGSMVYARTPLCLETLSRVYGREKMREALRKYALRFRFSHPTPRDLYQAIEGEFGAAVRQQTEAMLNDAAYVDLSLQDLITETTKQDLYTTFKVHREGSLSFPFDVLIEYKSGEQQRVQSVATQRTTTLSVTHQSPIRKIVVDPDRRILLDENFFNNRSRAPLPEEQVKTHASAISLASWVGFLLSL